MKSQISQTGDVARKQGSLGRRRRATLETLEARQLLAVLTVNTTADDETADATLSLREAIDVSNGTLAIASLSPQEQAQIAGALASPNTIDFNIPGTGLQTIKLTSSLPAITAPVVIDGYSQPGTSKNTAATSDNAKLLVQIDLSVRLNDTITIKTGNSIIQGLILNTSFFAPGLSQGFAIHLDGATATGNIIRGNFLDVNAFGTAVHSGLSSSILVNNGASNNTIGGTSLDARNVISGAQANGAVPTSPAVVIGGTAPSGQGAETGNLVEGNFIGVGADGNSAVGSVDAGLFVGQTARNTSIGGAAPGAGNVVSGNSGVISNPPGAGIIIEGQNTTIQGNLIGTNAAGNAALGNQGNGVQMDTGAMNVTIGGTSPGARNVIAANSAQGIEIGTAGTQDIPVATKNILIEGNLIGSDLGTALGNGGDGVRVNAGGTQVTIGGNASGAPNVIAFNHENGVLLNGPANGLPGATAILIEQNSIFGNQLLGIAEQPGTNDGIAAPVLSSLMAPDGGIVNTGTLTGKPNTNYRIEFFGNAAADPLGFGQGHFFLGALTVTTGVNGQAGPFPVPSTAAPGINQVTATATDPAAGTTSAFSNDVPVSGTARVATTTVLGGPSPSAPTVGQPVIFAAIVQQASGNVQPTGSITFLVDNGPQASFNLVLINGLEVALFSTNTLSQGQHTIIARYDGTSSFSPSTSTRISFTVQPAGPVLIPTETTLFADPNPAVQGSQVGFAAIVLSQTKGVLPTGNVIFSIDGKAQPPVTLADTEINEAFLFTTSLTPGPHTIVAVYAGDGTFAPSASQALIETINPAQRTGTVTTLASSPNPSIAGQPMTFTALVSPELLPQGIHTTQGLPTGSVTFTINGVNEPLVGLSVVNGQAQATFTISSLPPGQYHVTASYLGDAEFSPSTSQVLTQVVLPVTTGDGPVVTGVQRFGFHAQPTTLVLFFDEQLDAASAQNVANYKILSRGRNGRFGGPGSHRILVDAAAYDPAAQSVTLAPQERMNVHLSYQLTVNGRPPNGLRDTSARLLDGKKSGRPGSNFVTVLSRQDLLFDVPAGPLAIQARGRPASRSRSH